MAEPVTVAGSRRQPDHGTRRRTTVRAMALHVHETDSAADQLQVRPQFAQLGEISEVPKLRLAPSGRKIPMVQLMREEALEAFREWEKSPIKVRY